MKGIIFSVMAGLILASCTIKEDREPCPCWLLEDLSECYGSDSPLYLSAWKGSRIYMEAIDAKMYPAGFEKKVPRELINVSACKGVGTSFIDGHHLLIPAGSEADSIYAHRNIVDATGETAYDLVMMHKQFATIVMDIESYNEESIYSLEVTGDVCGMDLLDLSPLDGSFTCTPRFIKEGRCAVRVPRQKAPSLELKIVEAGSVTKLIDLGGIIERSSYSWNDEDLKDIYINIDYQRCTTSITVLNWDEGGNDLYSY